MKRVMISFLTFVFLVVAFASLGMVGHALLNRPVPHCKEMVAMSKDCVPFGCSKTYVNERGEDTGECR